MWAKVRSNGKPAVEMVGCSAGHFLDHEDSALGKRPLQKA